MYLKNALRRPGSKNITKINLSKNKDLSEKAGIFLGDALIENPDHPVKKINFKDVCLGENGLMRIIEAANQNQNIKVLNVGVVTSVGLLRMAQCLRHNKSLEKLKFTESEVSHWSENSKSEFVAMLKEHKYFEKVKFEAAKGQDHKAFKKEIEFFVRKIKKCHEKNEDIEERKVSCTNEHLFASLLEMIENREDHEKMPVRKFFMNTFNNLMNDAIFALMKKQRKSNKNEILTMQGSIRFVSQYLMAELPENEREYDSEAESGEDGEENEEAEEAAEQAK